jgi:hypothetical protein
MLAGVEDVVGRHNMTSFSIVSVAQDFTGHHQFTITAPWRQAVLGGIWSGWRSRFYGIERGSV